MLVIRSFSGRVLAKGKNHKEIQQGLANAYPGSTRKFTVRKFRVRGNFATWDSDHQWSPFSLRGYIEPENYTRDEIEAVLADIQFEGWAFRFDPLPPESAYADEMVGWIHTIPPAESGIASNMEALTRGCTKRQIVHTARELVRETLYAALVAPLVREWHQRCTTGFRYCETAVADHSTGYDKLNELLGPRALTWLFKPSINDDLENRTVADKTRLRSTMKKYSW